MRKNRKASTIGALTLAAGGLTVAAALPAAAAPSGAGNPVGNGITAQQMTCNGTDVTILVAENRGQSGWGVGRVVGGGNLIPVSYEWSLVDLSQPDAPAVFSDRQLKGGGNANHQQDASVTCVQSGDTGQTFAALLDSAPPGYQLPSWVDPKDEAGFEFTVTAIPKP